MQPLVWFCTQLQKDIDENLQQKPEQKAASVPAEHEDQVQEVMEKLKAHPQCQLVHFVPSRMLFRIRKKNLHGPANAGKVSEFKVLGLNKWRKTEGASGDHKTLSRSACPWASAFWMVLRMFLIHLLLLVLTHSNKPLENIRV